MKILDDVQRLKAKVLVTQERLATAAAANIKAKGPESEDEEEVSHGIVEEPDIEDNKRDLLFEEVEMKLEPDVIVAEEKTEIEDELEVLEWSGDEEELAEGEDYNPEPKKVAIPKGSRKRKSNPTSKTGTTKKAKTASSEDPEETLMLKEKMRALGLLHCHLCNVDTESLLGFQRHQRDVHNMKQSSIQCCARIFGRSSILSHMRYHNNPDAFKCDECGGVFLSKYKLSDHKLRAHVKPDQVQFSCEICGKGFGLKQGLDVHRLSHVPTEQRRIKCAQCDFKTDVDSVLTAHIRVVHEKAMVHICEVCGKGFATKYKRDRHFQNKHAKTQSEECEICHKSVFNKAKHIERVHNAVEIQCEHCDYKGNKDTIKNHINKYHSGRVVSLDCPFCSKEYKSPRTLKEHIEVVHKGIKYACDFCPHEASSTGNKYNHMKQKHAVEYAAKRLAELYTPKVKN